MQDHDQIEISPAALAQAWQAVGRRIAVIAGSATALLSLIQHTPVRVASMRGALVWSAVLATTSLGGWLAQKTWNAPTPAPTDDPPEHP